MLICHGWLGQPKDLFGMDEINMIEMDSCDGLQIGRLESSSYCDVAYPRLEGFSCVVFDPGGRVLTVLSQWRLCRLRGIITMEV